MPEGFEMTEDDGGTKEKVGKIIKQDRQAVAENFEQAMDVWWMNVKATAERLCIEYKCVDTWTLFNSIRIEFIGAGPHGAYAVTGEVYGPIEITRLIVAGGGVYINPKTGRVCDYAESVHDGTGKNIAKGPRPFLTDAIEVERPELRRILTRFFDKIKE